MFVFASLPLKNTNVDRYNLQWNTVITNSVIMNKIISTNDPLLHKSTRLQWTPVIMDKFCRSRSVRFNRLWFWFLTIFDNGFSVLRGAFTYPSPLPFSKVCRFLKNKIFWLFFLLLLNLNLSLSFYIDPFNKAPES